MEKQGGRSPRRARRSGAGARDNSAPGGGVEPELYRLQRQIAGGSYRPGPYRTFRIVDPKPRLISAAPFRDRVVHHALTNILEPIFERRFIPYSFACRTGFGTHKALAHARRACARYSCVLKLDVRKYFPSIDHRILQDLLARLIHCPDTLRLIELIIASSNPQEEVLHYFPIRSSLRTSAGAGCRSATRRRSSSPTSISIPWTT